jgi:hypothetical protein
MHMKYLYRLFLALIAALLLAFALGNYSGALGANLA